MGNVVAQVEHETESWAHHQVVYDYVQRQEGLEKLAKIDDGVDFYTGVTTHKLSVYEYDHYFISDGKTYIEFVVPEDNLDLAHVSLNSNNRLNFRIIPDMNFKLDKIIRKRIEFVIGLNSYSLILRNCESIVRWIVTGIWQSSQVESRISIIANLLTGEVPLLIGTTPAPPIHKSILGNQKPMFEFYSPLFRSVSTAIRGPAFLQDNRKIILLGYVQQMIEVVNCLSNRNIFNLKKASAFYDGTDHLDVKLSSLIACQDGPKMVNVQVVISKRITTSVSKIRFVHKIIIIYEGQSELQDSKNHLSQIFGADNLPVITRYNVVVIFPAIYTIAELSEARGVVKNILSIHTLTLKIGRSGSGMQNYENQTMIQQSLYVDSEQLEIPFQAPA